MPRTRIIDKAPSSQDPSARAPSPAESANYTYDMLISLKKIAALQKEAELVRLIEAAAAEAEAVSKRVPA
jgi:hypothetical protein